jgi:hypothetical protein
MALGGSIYLRETGLMSLDEIKVTSFFKLAVVISEGAQAIISRSEFYGISESVEIIGLYCDSCLFTSIFNCTFKNLRGEKGAAVVVINRKQASSESELLYSKVWINL